MFSLQLGNIQELPKQNCTSYIPNSHAFPQCLASTSFSLPIFFFQHLPNLGKCTLEVQHKHMFHEHSYQERLSDT